MFKCLDCGHIFEEGEQSVVKERHGFKDGPPEELMACPKCTCLDIAETVRCRICGCECLEEDMHGHICDSCIDAHVNYDSFFEYAIANSQPDELDDLEAFIFRELFGLYRHDIPTVSSPAMKNYFQEIYKREVASEKLLGTHTLKDKIYHYMEDWCVRDYFAEWIEERMNKHVH